MPGTRSSTRLASNANPTSGTDDVPPGSDPNFVDAEQAEADSEYDEPKESTLKRKRTNQVVKTATKTRGKQGRLAGLMKMPIDIFTEIALYLMPGDIIVLARSNKFFRSLLMNRSAIHIWHGVMRNVPDLPPCPLDMSEPHYLALIFVRNCSACGKTVTKRMDEILRVRLCGPCRLTSLVSFDYLPSNIRHLVYASSRIMPSKGRGRHWALRSDMNLITAELEEQAKSKDNEAATKWRTERIKMIMARYEEAAVLKAFFDGLESMGSSRRSDLRSERRNEIERRLKELGWDNKDLELDHVGTREWNQLVEQPKPLTERIWANIKPKLIPLLESNRTLRLEYEKGRRKSDRKTKLAQLLAGIKSTEPLCIDGHIPNPVPPTPVGPYAPTVQVSHRRIFPVTVDLLEYPIIKDLNETDLSASEMEDRFKEHREEIDVCISKWRLRVEEHLSGLIREGRVSDGLEEMAPLPVLSVEESEPNPFSNVSKDLKILLRADSLFEPTGSPHAVPLTYHSLVSPQGFSGFDLPRGIPIDLARYKRHAAAQTFARALLADMGKPDACFLEMMSIGSKFICGRCYSPTTYTWEEMIRHYMDKRRDWERNQDRIFDAQKLNVTFKDVHAVDAETDKPFVNIISSNYYSTHFTGLGPAHFKCLLCEKAGVVPVGHTVQEHAIAHIIDVHGVAEPQKEEHYDMPYYLKPRVTE